ncbi:MAG: hypothetical protein FWC91_03215 [Defluviitaleaceae bacterium]|nr:hypothetical protein [Defluviitaleaceae bacterium]
MKIKFTAICTLVSLIGLFIACNNPGVSQMTSTSFELIELEFLLEEKRMFAAVLLEDSIIFAGNDTGPNSGINNRIYYRYYFESSSFVKIGTFNNFFMSTGDYVILDNMIFFDATLVDSNYGNFINVIFKIDLEHNTLIRRFEDVVSNPLFHIAPFDGGLISLKSKTTEGSYVSYLETFKFETNMTEIISELIMNADAGEGFEYLVHTTYNGKTYVMYSVIGGNEAAMIRVYGENMNILRSISLGESEQYIMANRPHTIRVFGDYVYILNYSMRSFIGKIESDNSLSSLHLGRLAFAPNSNNTSNIQLFFERDSANVVLLDTNTGLLHEITVDLDDGYSLLYIKTNGNTAFICLISEDMAFENYRYFLTNFTI